MERAAQELNLLYVTILCQSRLFSPQVPLAGRRLVVIGNHPLSIEAIFPTTVIEFVIPQGHL